MAKSLAQESPLRRAYVPRIEEIQICFLISFFARKLW
jgi:hypothetical protein